MSCPFLRALFLAMPSWTSHLSFPAHPGAALGACAAKPTSCCELNSFSARKELHKHSYLSRNLNVSFTYSCISYRSTHLNKQLPQVTRSTASSCIERTLCASRALLPLRRSRTHRLLRPLQSRAVSSEEAAVLVSGDCFACKATEKAALCCLH